MQLNVEKAGGVAVVSVNAEELDLSNVEEFKREVSNVLAETPRVVLDLSRVQFVDSNGCGSILWLLKQVTTAGGDLRLCGVNKPVRTVFEMIRLHRICEILPTREEAIKAFGS